MLLVCFISSDSYFFFFFFFGGGEKIRERGGIYVYRFCEMECHQIKYLETSEIDGKGIWQEILFRISWDRNKLK